MAADQKGMIARTLAGLKYGFTGSMPENWFGPGNTLADQAPPEVKGRTFDYNVSINTNYQPRAVEAIGFKRLKQLALQCEPLQMIMSRQRDLLRALEWTIKPKKGSKLKPDDQGVLDIVKFFERPDGRHDWQQWLGGVVDQLFVYDAVSIYARPTRGGGLYALEVIDGSTITPLVDAWGRQPEMPDAAYKQVLKGLPAVSYTTDELTYYPENYRVDHIYGHSRVQQLVTIAETSIAQLKSQLGYFTHGNVGDGYFTAPLGFNPDQIASIEKSWNAMMWSDGGQRVADKRKAPWLPEGSNWNPTKIDLFNAAYDEWLMRLICFAFGVPVAPFIKQTGMGHGTGNEHDAAEEAGIAQLMQFFRRLINRLLEDRFKRDDIEFSWLEDHEMDPKTAAEIDNTKVRNGTRTIDESRDRNGEPPLPDGLGAKPLIYTASGAVLLDTVINPPPPPPVPDMLGHNGGPALDDGTKVPPKPGQPTPGGTPEPLAKAASHASHARLSNLFATYLAKQADIIAPLLGEALGLAKASTPTDDDMQAKIDAALNDLDLDWSDLESPLNQMLSGIAVAAGTDALSELGLFDKAILTKMMARTTAFAEARAAELVGMKWVDGELVVNPNAEWSITEATRNMLRSSITTALEEGQSNDELAKTIRESTAFSRDRAENISRTETATADVQGSIAGWRASGAVAGRQWLAAPDCCDECQDLDGTIVGIDEDFEQGDAPLHQNCRCSELPLTADEMPDATEEEE